MLTLPKLFGTIAASFIALLMTMMALVSGSATVLLELGRHHFFTLRVDREQRHWLREPWLLITIPRMALASQRRLQHNSMVHFKMWAVMLASSFHVAVATSEL